MPQDSLLGEREKVKERKRDRKKDRTRERGRERRRERGREKEKEREKERERMRERERERERERYRERERDCREMCEISTNCLKCQRYSWLMCHADSWHFAALADISVYRVHERERHNIKCQRYSWHLWHAGSWYFGALAVTFAVFRVHEGESQRNSWRFCRCTALHRWHLKFCSTGWRYGVATIGRLLKITGLFCRI